VYDVLPGPRTHALQTVGSVALGPMLIPSPGRQRIRQVMIQPHTNNQFCGFSAQIGEDSPVPGSDAAITTRG